VFNETLLLIVFLMVFEDFFIQTTLDFPTTFRSPTAL